MLSKIQESGPVSGFNSEFTCETTNLYSEQNTNRMHAYIPEAASEQVIHVIDIWVEDGTYRKSGVFYTPFPHRYCRLLRVLST